MEKLPKVFIPCLETDRFNTTAAEQYGERIFLLQNAGPSVFNTTEIATIFSLELEGQGFDPATDYIALTGPTIMVALLYALAHKKHDRVKTLMFDARKNQYIERVVGLGNTTGAKEAS